MVARTILRNWLLVGLAGGAVGALQVYGATSRPDRAFALLALGFAIGIFGGIGRLYFEWRQGGLGEEPKQWTVPASRHLINVIPLALFIAAGFARGAGARPAVSIALTVFAAALSVFLLVVLRNRADAPQGSGR